MAKNYFLSNIFNTLSIPFQLTQFFDIFNHSTKPTFESYLEIHNYNLINFFLALLLKGQCITVERPILHDFNKSGR